MFVCMCVQGGAGSMVKGNDVCRLLRAKWKCHLFTRDGRLEATVLQTADKNKNVPIKILQSWQQCANASGRKWM